MIFEIKKGVHCEPWDVWEDGYCIFSGWIGQCKKYIQAREEGADLITASRCATYKKKYSEFY